MMNETQIQFLQNNNIKWTPLRLTITRDKKKIPEELRHPLYKRFKKSDGEITYIPNFIEFKDIDDDILKQRQFYYSGVLPYNAIDTYEVAQIDIDTPNVDKEWLENLLAETPYYKSLTKDYGYHIFVKLADFQPEKTTYHFRTSFPSNEEEGKTINLTPEEDKNSIELLTGKWGYIKSTTEIINYDKPIIEITGIKRVLTDFDDDGNPLLEKREQKEATSRPPVLRSFTKEPTTHYIKQEIKDHMLNIKQEYIDNYSHHIKIINAILRTGYEDIAYECMFRSSNTKNKDLDKEFNNFKNSKLYDITPSTLFYYSKLSNKKQFFNIIRKYEFHQLAEERRKMIIDIQNITKNIDTRYIPPNLINDYIGTFKKSPQNNEGVVGGETPTIIHLQSPMGTGKTTMMKSFLKKNPNFKVLYLSPRRTFSNDVFADLQYCGFNHYRNIKTYKKANNNTSPDRIIIQIESLHKIKDQKYDVVIIDEIESDLAQLVSSTNKLMITNHKLFQRFIQDAKIVICMDAFLSTHSQNIIQQIKPNTNTITIKNNYKTKTNWTAIELPTLKTLRDQAYADLEMGKKIVFVSSIKKIIHEFISCMDEDLHKKIRIKTYSADSTAKEKMFENINDEWNKYDCLIYTGVITCGVSFDPQEIHFDSIYCYASPCGSSIRDIHQSLQRVRKFKENKLYFCIDKNNTFLNKSFLSTDYLEIRELTKKLLDEKGHFNELPKWAIENFNYNTLLKNINYLHPLALFCEYLRIQGYKIIYYDYSDRKHLPFDLYPTYIEGCDKYRGSNNMTADEYEELQKNAFDLSWETRQRMKCYLFEVNTEWIKPFYKLQPNLFIALKTLYGHFKNEKIENFNVMFNEKLYYENMDYEIENNNELTSITTSYTHLKYNKVKELCNILNCKKIYELDYTTFDLVKKQEKLLKWISESEKYYKFRKTRGDEPIKYINSVIRYVSEDWCGFEITGKQTSKMKKGEKINYFKYNNYINFKKKEPEYKSLYCVLKHIEENIA